MAEVQQITQTEKARPTDSPFPSDTTAPSNTPAPTNTSAPSKTPAPTNTPSPTDTPTALPTPIVITGSGDSIVDIQKDHGPALVHIIGNASSSYFGVKSYDDNNEQIDLLVNTTDPYDGFRPLDFLDDQYSVRFEVQATGDWIIEILPLGAIEKLTIPGNITRNGDYVFAIVGGSPDTATITGNASSSYFGVFGYGNTKELLVNTTDPYNGTVMLGSDIIIIEVQAMGEWTMSFTTR